jgi:hypothetical protein
MLKVKIILCDKLNNEYLVARFAKLSEAYECAKLLQSLTSTEGHWYYVEHKNRRHLSDLRVVSKNLKNS